jgi:hypothetical protein
LRDDFAGEVLPKIAEQRARLDEHDTRIARLEQSEKDNTWKSDKLYNVKISMTGKVSGQFSLERDLTDA